MEFKLYFVLPENIANELLLYFNAHKDKRHPNSLNKGGYSPNISEEGAKQPWIGGLKLSCSIKRT